MSARVAERNDSGVIRMQCLECNKDVQSDWAACPWFGAKIPKSPTCEKCGKQLKAAWKSCPFCGQVCSGGQQQSVSIQDSVVKGDLHLNDARDQSSHHTTTTNNSTTNVGQQFVGSTVNINHSPNRAEQAAGALKAGENDY